MRHTTSQALADAIKAAAETTTTPEPPTVSAPDGYYLRPDVTEDELRADLAAAGIHIPRTH